VNFVFVQVSFSNPIASASGTFFFCLCSVEFAAFKARLLVDVDGGELRQRANGSLPSDGLGHSPDLLLCTLPWPKLLLSRTAAYKFIEIIRRRRADVKK
jgi:hypothetical protein